MNLLWQPITDIIDNSPWFCLEENTQITLENGGTKALKDIKVGDSVATLEGSSVVDNVFDNGVQECKTVSLENGRSITGTDEHRVRCLSEDGLSLTWKKIRDLTENDYVVTE
jgi:intein/homing endonuclease